VIDCAAHAKQLLSKHSSPYILCNLTQHTRVLITAPHSMKLLRGGKGTPEQGRKHLRERHAAEAALGIAKELNRLGIPTAFMLWNRGSGYDERNLDPNCLWSHMLTKSPWHQALHQWASRNDENTPLLHIDLHGKCTGRYIDIGACPMEEVFPSSQQRHVAAFKAHLARGLDTALDARCILSKKGNPMMADVDPDLHGYWGEDTATTMSHQSVLLGIPAVQFECPPILREKLVIDKKLVTLFAEAIAGTYHDVVVPWWPKTPCYNDEGRLRVDGALGRDLVEVETHDVQGLADGLVQELMVMEARIGRTGEKQI